jgi:hypothetical protein
LQIIDIVGDMLGESISIMVLSTIAVRVMVDMFDVFVSDNVTSTLERRFDFSRTNRTEVLFPKDKEDSTLVELNIWD